jgi:hypothetical protein
MMLLGMNFASVSIADRNSHPNWSYDMSLLLNDTEKTKHFFWNQSLLVSCFLNVVFFSGCFRSKQDGSNVLIEHGLYPNDPSNNEPGTKETEWVVGLYNNGFFICSGFLVNQTKVVTASHCFRDQNNINGIKVKIIDKDYAVSKVEKHDGYIQYRAISNDPNEHAILADKMLQNKLVSNDIAVVTLSTPAGLAPESFPILVTKEKDLIDLGIPGGKFTFFGQSGNQKGDNKGKTSYGLGYSKGVIECSRAFSGNLYKLPPFTCKDTVTAFCKLSGARGQRLVPGDSGGPATVYRNGRHYVVGINRMKGEGGEQAAQIDVFETFVSPAMASWLEKRLN